MLVFVEVIFRVLCNYMLSYLVIPSSSHCPSSSGRQKNHRRCCTPCSVPLALYLWLECLIHLVYEPLHPILLL